MEVKQVSDEDQKILALFQQFKASSVDESNRKKVLQALRNSRKALDEAIKLLEGTPTTSATDDKNPDAPHGLKKDGTPKKAPGRAAVKPATKDEHPAEPEPSI